MKKTIKLLALVAFVSLTFFLTLGTKVSKAEMPVVYCYTCEEKMIVCQGEWVYRCDYGSHFCNVSLQPPCY